MSPQTQDASTRRMTRNSNPDEMPPGGFADDSAPIAAAPAAVDKQASAPIESTASGARDDGGGEGDDDSASITTTSSKRIPNKRKYTLSMTTSKKTARKKTAKNQGGLKEQQQQFEAGPSSVVTSADRTQSFSKSATSANSHQNTSLQVSGNTNETSRVEQWDQDEMLSSDELTSSDDPNDEPYVPSQTRVPSGASSASKRRRKPAAALKTNRKSAQPAQRTENRAETHAVSRLDYSSRFDHSSTRSFGAFPALQSLADNVEAVIRAARTRSHSRLGLQSESHQRLKASIEVLPNPPQRAVLALLLNFCETQEAELPAFPLSPAKVAIFLARATDTPFGERLRRRFPQPSTYPLPIAGRDDQGILLGLSEGSRVDLALIRCWLQAFCYAQGAIAPVWAPALSPFDSSLASIAGDPAIVDIVATFQHPEPKTSSCNRTKSTAMGSGPSRGTLQTSQAAAGPDDPVIRPRSQGLQAAGARTAQRDSAMDSLSQAISEHNARAARWGSTVNQRPREATTLMASLLPQLAAGNLAPTLNMTHRPQNTPIGIVQPVPMPDRTWTPSSSIASRPWPLSNYGSMPPHFLPVGSGIPVRYQASNVTPAQVRSNGPATSANPTQSEPHLRSASAASSLSDFQPMPSEAVQTSSTPYVFDRIQMEHHETGSMPPSAQFDPPNDAAWTARGPVRQGDPSPAGWQSSRRPPRIGMLLNGQMGGEARAQDIGSGVLHQFDGNGDTNIGALSCSPSMRPPPPPTTMNNFARRGSMTKSMPDRVSSSTPTARQEVLPSTTSSSLSYGNGTQIEIDNSTRWSAPPSAPTLIALPADVRPVGWFVEAETMRTIQIGSPQVTATSYSAGTMPRAVLNPHTPSYLGNPYFSTPVARPPPIRQRASAESQPTAGLASEIATSAHASYGHTIENESNRLSRPPSTVGSAPPEHHRSSLHPGLEVSASLEGPFLLDNSATPSTYSAQNGHNNSQSISATPINKVDPRTYLDPTSPSNARPVDSPLIYRESPLSLKEVSRAHST